MTSSVRSVLIIPLVLLVHLSFIACSNGALTAARSFSAPSTDYSFESDLSVSHPTSGLRYAGANFASPQLLQWGVQATRVGGDDQTVYNWKTDTSNADNDFYWTTGTPYHPFQPDPPKNSSFVDLMLINTVRANSTLFLLVPTSGWVDAGKIEEGCGSFPVSDYGHQQSEYQNKWGNGVYPNGTYLRGDWRCYVPFGLPDVLEWLRHLRGVVGDAAFDRHVVLQLDNEYDLWGFVHRDVHPALVTYDELWSVTVTFASSIKHNWPHARIAGPVSYGWCGWWWSELDGCVNNGTDYKTHANMYLMPWFLQQLERYYQATGIQLIDVLDNHYYPNLPANSSTPDNRAQYFGEVRSWWDPNYRDPSWIGQCGERCGGPSLMVLPRFHAWMRQYAPSLHLELAITEYAFGFDDSDETAAAVTAESIAVLGQFNATWGLRWISPAPGSVAEQVWRLWHNWDGQGASLHGDFVATSASRSDNISAYTIHNSASQQLFVLLFSHSESDVDCSSGADKSTLVVQHATTAATSAATYELAPGRWNLTAGAALSVSSSSGSVTVTGAACGMAARSIRLLVLRGVSLARGVTHSLYAPWLDERYAAIDWNEPLINVEQHEQKAVADKQISGLHATRASKKRAREYSESSSMQTQQSKKASGRATEQ